MLLKYTHLKLNEEYPALAGSYTPEKEVRLKYDGKEVLYVIGQANIDRSCCAANSLLYAIVPGFIINWQMETSNSGLPVSEVEPVSQEKDQNEIRKIIETTENASPIGFW